MCTLWKHLTMLKHPPGECLFTMFNDTYTRCLHSFGWYLQFWHYSATDLFTALIIYDYFICPFCEIHLFTLISHFYMHGSWHTQKPIHVQLIWRGPSSGVAWRCLGAASQTAYWTTYAWLDPAVFQSQSQAPKNWADASVIQLENL